MGIKNKDGRYYSERTPQETEAAYLADWNRLSEDEKELVRKAYAQSTRGETQLIDAIRQIEYEEEPVSPRQFFTDPYYIGEIAHNLYPKVREDLIEIFEGGYHEVILGGSIGYGKTTSSVLILFRMLYESLCLVDPARSYGLAAGSKIHFLNLSIRVDLAKKVIFEQIAQRLADAPWFRAQNFVPTQEGIKFPKNIEILAGGSSPQSIIGTNAIGAILDEGNFFAEIRGGVKKGEDGNVVDQAAEIYGAIMSRMKSRYAKAGKLPGVFCIVSSKRRVDDFTERRLRQAANDPTVFAREYAIWDVKTDDFAKEKFKVLVGNELVRSRILLPEETKMIAPEGCRLVDVPEDLRIEFERDLDRAIRDFAGLATTAVEPFFAMREKLGLLIDKGFQHPLATVDWIAGSAFRLLERKLFIPGKNGVGTPLCCPHQPRHCHIDPSTKHCATGFAIGHICGTKPVEQRENGIIVKRDLPVFRIDFVLKVIPPPGEEIIMGDVYGIVQLLWKKGLPIESVAMDSWQSVAPLQDLRKLGFKVDTISVQRPGAYELFKQICYEERVRVYEYAPLMIELQHLEYDRRSQRVGFPPGFSKDVSDAVAGVVFYLAEKEVSRDTAPPLLGESLFPRDDSGDAYAMGDTILWADEESQPADDSDDGAMPFLFGDSD